jgi:hypothetical protein
MKKNRIYQLSAIWFGLAFVLFAASGYSAHIGSVAAVSENCPSTDATSGWIKVDNLNTTSYTYTVPTGYTVTDNCYKAGGTITYRTGATVTSTVFNKVGCVAVGNPSGCNYRELSHASFKLVEDDSPEVVQYYFQFDKIWNGDTDDIVFDAIRVTFTANSGFVWVLGTDSPVHVTPGATVLTNVQEVVTGLPENCEYTSNLPGTITAPSDTDLYNENQLFTLTVTNTVTCDEDGDEEPPVLDEDGNVLGDSTDKGRKQVVAPRGGVNAGAGNAHVIASSLAGLAGSLTAVSYGAVRIFRGE